MLGYRLVWITLFAAGLATAGYLGPRDEAAQQLAFVAASEFGFYPFVDDSLEGQLGSPLGDEGQRIGFRNGDLLLTVDGHAMPVDKTAQTRILAGPAGGIAVLGLRRDTGERYAVRVARDPARLTKALAGWGMNFAVRRWTQFGFGQASAVALLAAAALLFIRRPRDPVAQLLAFSIVLGVPDFVQLLHVGAFAGQLIWQASWVLMITALLLFPDGRLGTRWHWLTIFLFIVTSISQLVNYWYSLAALLVSLFYFAPFAAMVLAIVTQYRRMPEGAPRQQAKFVLFGIVAFCIAFAVSGVLLAAPVVVPMSVGATMWISMFGRIAGALALAALPAGLFVSLFRYRLYDVESTISRSVVYGSLTLALLAIFAGSEKMIEIFGERYFGERLGALASGLGAGFAALMMVPLHRRVTHWAEHRFQGNLVNLRAGLPVLMAGMSATATPERLADVVLARVEKGVRAIHGSVILDHDVFAARDIVPESVRTWLSKWREPAEGESQLHVDRDDPLFPMRVPLYSEGVGMAGWLLLGPRPDGSFYGKDERDTLLAIAEPVAHAIVVARQRSERGREIGGITRRLTAVETRLTDFNPLASGNGIASFTVG